MFVARERELGQLDDFLCRALAGQGQVCFVTGEAGSGKTSLVSEFARRAQDQHHDLIVAAGQADAETGSGDPYLPFREVLALLTGDVEAKLSQGAITQENATRLRTILALSGEALVECGADLIGAFVPGAALAMRAGAFVAKKAGWLAKLEQLAAPPPEGALPASGGVEQSHILEQYTNVIRALAQKRPLLLVLDDLQWADSASMGLLFRLGRRIADSRILIVGTYRPEEVALGRAGERHPLQKVLAEFKRYRGDVCVDLDRTQQAEGRRFVDALLDSEPNRLGQAFRAAMYGHTGGHPLFTVELLRDMQERGALVQDGQGRWVEDRSLNWELLPTRVEGVIEERIGRLEEELREVLRVASVEGEDFTAQVVARVREMNERDLVRRLSRELDRQHRLVQEEGMAHIREQRLSLYRFRHNLFQKYLYNDLGQAEREWLHEDVGNVLEALYGEQVDEIVVQLAWHFERAGVRDKARHYLQRAGEQAWRRYAYDEAVAYLGRALALTPQTEHAARYALLSARERAYETRGVRDAQRADLAALQGLAETLDDDGRRAEVALRQAGYAEATSDFPASIAAAQRAIDLAQHKIGDSQVADGLVAEAHLVWGRALWQQGDFDSARTQLGEALGVARRASLRPVETKSLRTLGNISAQQGDYGEARTYYQESLRICREIGDRLAEAGALNNLGIISIYQGDCAKAESYLEQALRNSREIGDRPGEERAFSNLAHVRATMPGPGHITRSPWLCVAR
jgi:adenylate cyclase